MRRTGSIIAAGDGSIVTGTHGEHSHLVLRLADRIDSGAAFPGERVVRIPRRLVYDICYWLEEGRPQLKPVRRADRRIGF